MQQTIIYVPGLNDDRFPNRYLSSVLPVLWKQYGFHLVVIPIRWRTGNFESKLRLITEAIDVAYSKNSSIYLVGQSAGGAAVLNAYFQRKNKIKKVVNVCGRLRRGERVFPTLALAARGNSAFEESVLLFEQKNEKKLTDVDRKKVLTLRPIFDEVVPRSTVPLVGATNIVLPVVEHSLVGMLAMTFFSKIIRDFLRT